MFTGLIEDIGTLRARNRRGSDETLIIETAIPTAELELGESIAVNGCCLTVTTYDSDSFQVDASVETLALTSIAKLKVGDRVHLERAMKVGGRLGGHIVQGHVDGVGTVERIIDEGRAWQLYVTIPEPLRPEVVSKGSIAVDGVSLTVNELTARGCRLTIIPFTESETLLIRKAVGDPVNIETDVIGKYVRHLLKGGPAHDTTAELLARYGYLSED